MPDKSRFDQHGQKVIGQQINVAGDATLPPPPLVLVPHLPAPPRDFTGRDEELKELLAGFERGATITGLRGMGGVGKTALAYALTEKLADRYPDGQILVELRGTSPEPMTAGEAMARVVRAYHLEFKPPESEAELACVYHSLLHNLRVLLLLDNAASREQVEPLLPPPECAVIVTSRNRFALMGLKAKDLDVLPLVDAKKLLLDIADRIGGQAEELARLCGCLPIALRNAAYVLSDRKDLGVAEYLERLKEARNRVELVEASFSLSYDLLSPELRRLWCLLSVFPPGAGFDREGAAAAVWALDQDSAASSLSDLVKWSLVEFDPAIRRYRLHDLARDFADSRLPSREKGEAEERHAEHYRSVLSASDDLYMQGGDSLQAGLTLFDREWANIQAGQSWAEKKLENRPAAASLCSLYPNAGAYLLDLRLNPKDKIRWRKTAVAAARQLKDLIAVGAHLGNLASAYYSLGEPLKAIEHYQQALAIAREFGDRHGEGYHLSSLGLVHAEVGDIRRAIEYYRQALDIAREIGDQRIEGDCLGNLGRAYAELGEPLKAIEHYERALAIAKEIHDRRNEGIWLGNLGAAYAYLDEPRKAIEYHRQALVIARKIVDRRSESACLGSLGLTYAYLVEPRKAIEYYQQALAIAKEIGYQRGEEVDMGNLGAAYADLGEPLKAIEYYEQALAIAREIGDRRGEGNRLFNMSLAQDSLGKRSEAVKLAKEALAIYEQIESPYAEKVRQQLAEWQGES